VSQLVFLIPLQSVAFGGLLLAFTAVYNTKVLVSGYQLVDMPCIVLPVKYDGWLSILVLRNEQLFRKKIWGSKPISFQKVPIFKNISPPAILRKRQTTPLERVPFLLCSMFLVNWIDNPPSNLT
jgi:hypothetical protein